MSYFNIQRNGAFEGYGGRSVSKLLLSVIDTATSYGLGDRGAGVRVLVGGRASS
jgi:hypothetical protein